MTFKEWKERNIDKWEPIGDGDLERCWNAAIDACLVEVMKKEGPYPYLENRLLELKEK